MTCDRITEDSIELLIRAFYDKVRRDPQLRPIFAAAIGSRWDAHIAKICAFWAWAMRISKAYRGDMLAVHQRLGQLPPELFERWLSLFNETVAEHFADVPAAALRDRAEKTAKNLQMALSHPMGKASRAATETRNSAFQIHADRAARTWGEEVS